MYHSISDEPETGHPYYWINTSPARFAEHMKFLHDNNYQVISLSTAVDLIRSRSANPHSADVSSFHHSTIPPFQSSGLSSPASSLHHSIIPSFHHSNLPSRYVVLTFDDGYHDFYTGAFPVLQSYGFTATAFLPTAYVDGKRPGLRGKEHLTWDHARELSAAGISFGSHTVNHPELHDFTWSEIEFELRRSKEVIESHITTSPVDSFCYPYRFPEQDRVFTARLAENLQSAGYRYSVSARLGAGNKPQDLGFMRRLPITSADDARLFAAKLLGGYDWLHPIQLFIKKRSIARPSPSRPEVPV
jgi:peptidoglycan/xylan/chitin deacetylase (PgdA/CDA1 family)